MTRAAVYFAAPFLLSCAAFTAPLHGTGTVPAANPVTARASSGCADFLGRMDRKPAHARYIGCTYQPGRQGKPLRAVYRVGGQFAAMTETYLIKTTGLSRLKRSCCQWDAPAHQFKDAKGQEFSITMVSGETPVATRAAWQKIPVFEITVETLTEEI